MNKAARLLDLAHKRQMSRWPGYKPLAEYHDGAYECDLVSPYTKAAGNIDAAVMILLQDWSSDDRLSGELDSCAATLGLTPSLPTNRNLDRLLKVHFGLSLRETYATNLFPFIKPGKLSSAIRGRDLQRAAREFAIPQIDIVLPRLVICLGLETFNALRTALAIGIEAPMDRAIGTPFSRGETRIWCQAHTGMLGQNNRNRGGIDRVSQDWLAMKMDACLAESET
jgi:uracil-DNA glycosylase